MRNIKSSPWVPCRLHSTFQGSCQLWRITLVILLGILAGCNQAPRSAGRYSGTPPQQQAWNKPNPSTYDQSPAPLALPAVGFPGKRYAPLKAGFIVNQLDANYRGVNAGPIGVTTFVNIDDLYSSSTFGRLYAEEVMGELSTRGYDVVELRLADALQFLAANGEFALSRDVGMVQRERNLGGVVVGTYVASPARVYVNARLVDPRSSVVLSAGSIDIERSPEVARLLRTGSVSTSLERIPVVKLGGTQYPAAWSTREEELGESSGGWRPPVAPKIPPAAKPSKIVKAPPAAKPEHGDK